MNLDNVRWIYLRELRDQLRDRRTLFTIFLMPMLLYPLLGAVFLQAAQFLREHPARVLILGAESLPESPALIEGEAFSLAVCDAHERDLLRLHSENASRFASAEEAQAFLRAAVNSGEYDVGVFLPADFGEKLAAFQSGLRTREASDATATTAALPEPILFRNLAADRSRVAFLRLDAVLASWRSMIVRANLRESRIPETAVAPFEVEMQDVAEPTRMKAAVWSKVLPFVLLVWALTGAFYPAIDLCAGEKERGTLETLLSSPALRSEIVWGKLLTVMTFSMATSVCNLLSMGFTGTFIVRQLSALPGIAENAALGPPPFWSALWLLAALPLMSALFSALSLAIAAFARSSKEGQYYLMPLLMVMLPLMTLPMHPAAQLELGTSIVPVTGLMLLLRALMEGQLWNALPFVIPVIAVNAACCFFAVRWAIDQFNRESVLFRESERWELGAWMRNLVRERGDTPTFGEAMLCAILLLVIRFFASAGVGMPESWSQFQTMMLLSQLAFFAAPPILMAVMLTRRPDLTLLARPPSFVVTVPAAALLAFLLHPALMAFSQWVMVLYPLSSSTAEQLAPLAQLMHTAPFWQTLLVMALVPALCEEIAFRGFILSGFRRMGHKWTAIALASLFFGVTHGILQQSISTFAVGLVLGYLAVKTGSLIPAITFHCVHNGLGLGLQRFGGEWLDSLPLMELFLRHDQAAGGVFYTPWYSLVSVSFAAALLLWYKSLPFTATREEALQTAIDRQPTELAQCAAR